jgi:uncharacterized protein
VKLHLDGADGGHVVTHYGAGRVVVSEEPITTACLVSPRRLVREWGPEGFDDLTREHMAAVAELDPELVVLGTGARQRFPAGELLRPLMEAGIGVEVMDTGAACRTYNILMGEGRRVAAALIMIEIEVDEG